MENMETELVIFCNQASLSVMGLGCIRPSYRLRGSHGHFQTTQTDARIESHSLKTNSGVPIAEENVFIPHWT